jgi:hypothetical protein
MTIGPGDDPLFYFTVADRKATDCLARKLSYGSAGVDQSAIPDKPELAGWL